MAHNGERISISHVRKSYVIDRHRVEVLKDINLEVAGGDIVSIVGKSGCGKSTLLRLIAALEPPDAGEIRIGARVVNEPSLDTGVLFQEPRLLPWQNVAKNVSFGLPERFPKDKRAELVERYVTLVGLEGFEQALPNQLSGGMQMRVALARTLINRPSILLLDEPFGALDAFTRINLQNEVLRIWGEEHMTTVLVTHDIEEAIFLGDRVVAMSSKPGVVQQVIDVALDRPRDRTSTEFELVRKRVYSEFSEEKNKEDAHVI